MSAERRPKKASADDNSAIVHDVEEKLEELGDPEGSPALPSASLAATSALDRAPAARPEPADRGSRSEIWRLAWPVMLSQLMVGAIGLIDIAMVGRLGADAVAAVGYASQFFFLVQSALFAVGFACVALMSHAIGASDFARSRRALRASLLVSVGSAVVLSAPIVAMPFPLLALLSAEPQVAELTVPYLMLLLASGVLFAVSMVLDSALRADRDTATPMRIVAVVTAVKIVLNVFLIFGYWGFPRLELVGAGVATVVSQFVAVTLFAWVLLRRPKDSPVRPSFVRSERGYSQVKDVVRIALPGVGERVIMNLALLSYFAILGRYGTIAVAAYTVGIRVLSFSWIPGQGFSAAAATLVGQSLGAGDGDEASRVGWRAVGMALAVATVLGAACAVGRYELAGLFIGDARTVATMGPFMLCVALAQPMLQVHFTLGGAHRGAGDTWNPMFAAAVGNWLVRVPLAVLLAFVFELDLVWIWVPLIFDHLCRAVWLAWTFKRGGWRRALSDDAVAA